jgi:hypothetical protein
MLGILAGIFLLASSTFAISQPASIRVFSEYDKRTLLLDGKITLGTFEALKRRLDEFPEVRFLALNSPGGSVIESLEIAKLIELRGITTLVNVQHECFSACSFIFFAGKARYVKGGQLGVHQFSGSDDEALTQTVVAEVYDTLLGFGISSQVMSKMFRTPSDQMYVFSDEELISFGINRYTKPVAQTIEIEESAESEKGEDTRNNADQDPNYGVTPLETRTYGLWTSGYYYYNSIANLMCALHSNQQGIDFRLVRYLTRSDYFLEIVNIPFTMEEGQVELVFGFEGVDSSGNIMTLRTEFTAWGGRDVSTDIKSQRDEEAILSMLTKGTQLWIRRIDTEFIGGFSLVGSSKAISDFRKCMLGDDAYVTEMLGE